MTIERIQELSRQTLEASLKDDYTTLRSIYREIKEDSNPPKGLGHEWFVASLAKPIPFELIDGD
jgi:hypothetical protein